MNDRWKRRGFVALVVSVVVSALLVGSPTPAQEAEPDEPAAVGAAEIDSPIPVLPPVVAPDPAPNGGPLSPPVPADTPASPPTELGLALAEARETGQRVPVEGRWTETTAVYAEPDGLITEEVHAGPVRVADGDGWVPVDPTLVETEDGIAPQAVPQDVVISDGGSEPLVDVTDPTGEAADPDDESVALAVPGSLPAPELDGATASYPDALDGADLVVTAKNVGIEVSIVIPDAASAQDSYELAVDAEGFDIETAEGGGLLFTDEDGDEVGSQTAPFMFDAAAAPLPGLAANSGPVTSEVIERDGQAYVRITPDADYLADPATQYPVTIDPITDFTPAADTFVAAAAPTTAYDSSTHLYVGTNGFTGATRTFMKWGTTAIEDTLVYDADLQVYQDWAGSCTSTALNAKESGYFFTAGTTWNTQPATPGSVVGTVNTVGDTAGCPAQVGWKSVDITPLAQTWATNADTWGAVALLANETNAAHAKAFWSRETAKPPKLTIKYLHYPYSPTNLSPANNATVTTLRPTLKAKLDGPTGSDNIITTFKIFDGATEVVSKSDTYAPGTTVEWSVPKDKLRVGRTYTWTVQGCTGYLPAACGPMVTRTFTVNPGLAVGSRGFFTYDTTGISERSGISVNVATGNLSVSGSDMTMAGIDTALNLARTYNSLGRENGMFGQRWTGTYTSSIRLVPESDGSFVYYGPSGEAVRIVKDGSTYKPSGDLDATFVDGTSYYGVYLLQFNHDRGAFKKGDQLLFHHPDSTSPTGPSYALWGVRSRNTHDVVINYAGTTAGSAISSVTDTQGRVVTYSTTSGRITAQSYGGRSVGFTYDGNGDLDTVTDAEGNVTNYDYTGHLLTKITSPGSRVIDITYDSRGRATSVKRTVSGVVEESTYTYTDTPVLGPFETEVRDARLNVTTYEHDHAGRVTRAFNALNQKVSKQYDDNSNVTSITDMANQTYTYGWSADNRNNLEDVIAPTGATATASYDQMATVGLTPYEPESTTDAQGNETGYTFDSAGNALRTDLPTGSFEDVKRHGINGVTCTNGRKGQVCEGRNAAGVVTSFAYEADGDLNSITPPSPLGAWEMDYDTFGRLTLIDDGRNTDRTFVYDDLDRMVEAEYDGGSTIGFVYDAYGSTTSRTDLSGTWGYDYDEANRLLEVDGPNAPSGFPAAMHDITFGYDTVGNLLSMEDIGGETTYAYSDINMVESVTDPDGNVTDYVYGDNEHGTWLTHLGHPNGAFTDIGRDDSGRVDTYENRDGNSAIVTSELIGYDDAGDDRSLRQKVTTPSSVTEYTYDALNQLDTVITTLNGGAPAGSYDYNYGAARNRTRAEENGAVRTFTYNSADMLTTTGVTHDGNGNMTAGGAHGYPSLAYNLLDQTTSVTPKSMSARTESYAGQLQSVWLQDAGTRFTTAASMGITATHDGTTLTTYVRDPSGGLVSMERGGNRYFYQYDGRGSIVALTDANGDVVQRYSYDPYGRLITAASPGTVNQPFRWNAQYAINDFDYKIGARWYDASLGRWTQRDPAAADPNAYAFSGNDPINNADPSGLGFLGIDCPFGETDSGGCNGASKEFLGNATAATLSTAVGTAACLSGNPVVCGIGVGVGVFATRSVYGVTYNDETPEEAVARSACLGVLTGIAGGLGAANAAYTAVGTPGIFCG